MPAKKATTQKISLKDFESSRVLSRHSARSREVARALDAGAKVLPHAQVFTSFEFEEFITQLTPKRFQLLRLAAKGGRSIADLAESSKRDRAAVSKDVAKLQKLGLVKVDSVANVGHGMKKIVSPVANTISINAAIADA